MQESNKALMMLTATVRPNNWIQKQWYTKTLNIDERRDQYISTILYYLSIEEISAIVFIDNCMYQFEPIFLENISWIAKNLWKEIEFLTFQWDVEKQLKYTYGYGEFETISYLFESSELFKRYKHIYKSTGRYRIYNVGKLIASSSRFSNLFYKYNIFNFNALNTVFFKLWYDDIVQIISRYDDIFEKWKYLIPKNGCEEVMFQSIKGRNINTLKEYPIFMTLSSFKYIFYNLLCKIWFFDVNSILFKTLSFISTCIPHFIRIKFHKVLNFFMKWVQKKKK